MKTHMFNWIEFMEIEEVNIGLWQMRWEEEFTEFIENYIKKNFFKNYNNFFMIVIFIQSTEIKRNRVSV